MSDYAQLYDSMIRVCAKRFGCVKQFIDRCFFALGNLYKLLYQLSTLHLKVKLNDVYSAILKMFQLKENAISPDQVGGDVTLVCIYDLETNDQFVKWIHSILQYLSSSRTIDGCRNFVGMTKVSLYMLFWYRKQNVYCEVRVILGLVKQIR